MRCFFLSGGGNAEQTLSINKIFARTIDKEKPILYLPIAGDSNIRPYDASYEYMKAVLAPLGINEMIMWTEVENKTLGDMQQFSAVYIGGGDPFRLLKEFRDTGFDKVITQYFIDGGTIYGQSAGAMIFGNHLEAFQNVNVNGFDLTNIDALNLVDGYSLWCHYQHENEVLIKKYVKKIKSPIIALPDGTAVFMKESEIKVIGSQPAYKFTSGGIQVVHPTELADFY